MNSGFFSHLVEGAISSAFVLAAPMLVLVFANYVFHALAPHDFNQVSIVRRAGVAGGLLLGGGIVLAAVFATKGQELVVLIAGDDTGMTLFLKLLVWQFSWFRPARLAQAPALSYWLVVAGTTMWLLPVISAAAYWNGRQRIGAIAISALIVPFMALSLVYAFTALVWFVHLLNIWSIAVAGLIYQHYRNSQLNHG